MAIASRLQKTLLWGAVVLLFVSPAFAAGAPPANPEHGRQIYAECAGCHAMTENGMGPLHCGLVGRRAGSVPGFAYSEVMRESRIVWTPEKLGEFLKSPLSYLPGTNMGYDGLYDARDRADLIAFLQLATTDVSACGTSAPQ